MPQQVSCPQFHAPRPLFLYIAHHPFLSQLTTAWTAICRHQRNHHHPLPAAITLLSFLAPWHYLSLLSPRFLVTVIYDLILGMFPPFALSVGAFHSGSCSCYRLISRRYVSFILHYSFVYNVLIVYPAIVNIRPMPRRLQSPILPCVPVLSLCGVAYPLLDILLSHVVSRYKGGVAIMQGGSLFPISRVMIPMMQAYVNTGDFGFTNRLKSAVRVNLQFYSIYIVIGFFGLIYLVFGSGYTTR